MRRVVQVLLRHIMSFVRMLKARRGPGQARPGQDRRGQAMPKPQRANKATTVDTLPEHWDQPAACISQCGCQCVYTHMHTYTHMYMCAHGPLYCQAAVQSLIMLMDIRFDLVELTRHTLLLLSSPSLYFPLFFVPGKAALTSCHLMSYIHAYIYTVCVVARTSSQCLAIYLT